MFANRNSVTNNRRTKVTYYYEYISFYVLCFMFYVLCYMLYVYLYIYLQQLSYDTLCEEVKKCRYDVRGEIYLAAVKRAQEGKEVSE